MTQAANHSNRDWKSRKFDYQPASLESRNRYPPQQFTNNVLSPDNVKHARKLTPKSFVDIGQGILEIIESMHDDSHA